MSRPQSDNLSLSARFLFPNHINKSHVGVCLGRYDRQGDSYEKGRNFGEELMER
jgi:hypothetical protein